MNLACPEIKSLTFLYTWNPNFFISIHNQSIPRNFEMLFSGVILGRVLATRSTAHPVDDHDSSLVQDKNTARHHSSGDF